MLCTVFMVYGTLLILTVYGIANFDKVQQSSLKVANGHLNIVWLVKGMSLLGFIH